MTGPFFAFVDWANDGTFAGTGEDVSDRVRGGVQFSYGRDSGTALSTIAAGSGQFRLDNTSRDYSPRNASSPLFGKVKAGRPVLAQRVVSSTTYTLFRGHTSDQPIDADIEAKLVTLNLVDYLGDFRGQNVTTTLYQGLRTGEAIGIVLDAVGWAGGRDIDTGSTIIPWFWADGADALNLLQELLASEGPPALLSVGVSGEIVFRDRHHRYVRAASTTSQATFRTTGTVEPLLQTGFTYAENYSGVVNDVSVDVPERHKSGQLTALWNTDETISLTASEARTVLVKASDPFTGAVAPVEGPDFAVVNGAVASVTVSRTSGQSTSITITAGAGGVTITDLTLRAYSVPVVRTYTITATTTDPTSLTDYGSRGIPSESEPVWASRQDVTSITRLYVLQRAQPLALVRAQFTCGDLQTALLSALLALDLSDRVTVNETETALSSADFFVEKLEHDAPSLTEHRITVWLEQVPAAPTGTQFVLGTSTLNGAHVLAY